MTSKHATVDDLEIERAFFSLRTAVGIGGARLTAVYVTDGVASS